MQTTTEKTVREIAVENPSSVRVFESLGIDYCCGGKRPLSEACAHANVDLERVIGLLATAGRDDSKAPANEDWTTQPAGKLIAHIVETHHAYVRGEVPRVGALLDKVAAKHGPTHPETAQIRDLFSAIGQELSVHLLKEELVLFPYIEQMEQATLREASRPPAPFGSVGGPIANMLAEHDDAGAVLAQIRQLSGGYQAPADACPTFLAAYLGLQEFERDLHHHIHLENNILFPRALEMEKAF